MKRILFLKFGALGDVLMTTPLLRQTRKIFAGAEINYCVAEPFAVALYNNPNLDRLLTFKPDIFTKFKVAALLKLIRQIRRERYDLIFVLDKHPVFAFIAFLAGIAERIGFVRDTASKLFLTRCVPFDGLRHHTQSNLDLLNEIGTVDYSDARMDFVSAPCNIDRFRLPPAYFACVNSGGDNVREMGSIRRLPSEKFLDLLRNLALQRTTILLGGKNDHGYYASLALPANVINLAGQTSLSECVKIIAHSEKFFTTDCGLMHLAATTDTRICAFFGPTHPKRKAPLRENVEWIWADEEIYDPEYEIRGRMPRSPYFRSLDFRRLLGSAAQDQDRRVDHVLATL